MTERLLVVAELYEREVAVGYTVGSAMMYRHDLWHRGTPLLPKDGVQRYIMSMAFRKADAEHCTSWQGGLSRHLYGSIADSVLCSSSVTQRCLLGFPGLRHPYWNADTISAVGARFEGRMDMTPYWEPLPPEARL